ncbi:glycosyltransferase family 2 protein [Epilithonimonas hispanica]|uniref:Glycosyltransferase 2-like domain-containing protein n=1 Tax=Epilithonimonas hispanica TaxID=358687 RepID=A0A3D9CU05_9FLAO|nr:glycosyltransferase [Epilithonimonas hispanica]REC69181.1 hypothetical protein DRF58_12600 [Epilithonimonas hispanica]
MLISVIVPVYNVEAYLQDCITSIIKQSYNKIEIILVNDGSTDNSGNICYEYETIDNRVRVIHKENGGVSSARNIGLASVLGEWFCFVDADDVLQDNFIETFTTMLAHDKCSSDIYIQGVGQFWNNDVSNFQTYTTYPDGKYTIENFLKYKHQDLIRLPVSKLYKTQKIRNHQVVFDNSLVLGEDTKFVFQYLLYCQSVLVSQNLGYLYRRLSDSLSNKKLEYTYDKKLLEEISTVLDSFVDSNPSFSKQNLLHHTSYVSLRALLSIYHSNSMSKKQRIKEVRWIRNSHPGFLLLLKKGHIKSKLMYVLLKFRLYSFFDFLYINMNKK